MTYTKVTKKTILLPKLNKKRINQDDEEQQRIASESQFLNNKGINDVQKLISHRGRLVVNKSCQCSVCSWIGNSNPENQSDEIKNPKNSEIVKSLSSHQSYQSGYDKNHHHHHHQKDHYEQQQQRQQQDWLYTLLTGLSKKGNSNNRTLKLLIADTFYFTDSKKEGLQIFYSHHSRLCRLPGTTPVKSLYSILTKFNKAIQKQIEQQSIKKNSSSKNDGKCHRVTNSLMKIQQKQYEKIFPSYFNNAYHHQSQLLQPQKPQSPNKKTKKQPNKNNYHQLQLYSSTAAELEQSQQNFYNKLKDNVDDINKEMSPFCIVRYMKRNNYQLFNQRQFKNIMANTMQVPLPEDILYVQSYIKPKTSDSSMMIYSEYTEEKGKEKDKDKEKAVIDDKMFKNSLTEVLILIEKIGKYDKQYKDIQSFQDSSDVLMKENPTEYAKLMTYKIVHFMAIVAGVYIRSIKIRWVINEIDNVYLQEIIQFQTRPYSFKRGAPHRQTIATQQQQQQNRNRLFYNDSQLFVSVHEQVKTENERVAKQISQAQNAKRLEQMQKQADLLSKHLQNQIKKGKVRTMTGLTVQLSQTQQHPYQNNQYHDDCGHHTCIHQQYQRQNQHQRKQQRTYQSQQISSLMMSQVAGNATKIDIYCSGSNYHQNKYGCKGLRKISSSMKVNDDRKDCGCMSPQNTKNTVNTSDCYNVKDLRRSLDLKEQVIRKDRKRNKNVSLAKVKQKFSFTPPSILGKVARNNSKGKQKTSQKEYHENWRDSLSSPLTVRERQRSQQLQQQRNLVSSRYQAKLMKEYYQKQRFHYFIGTQSNNEKETTEQNASLYQKPITVVKWQKQKWKKNQDSFRKRYQTGQSHT